MLHQNSRSQRFFGLVSCAILITLFLFRPTGIQQDPFETLSAPSKVSPLAREIQQISPTAGSKKIDLHKLGLSFFSNLHPHGLKARGLTLIEELPDGRLQVPEENPFESKLVQITTSVAVLQALSAANYLGMVESREYINVRELDKEAQGAAKTVGLKSLETLAEAYDVAIVIGGGVLNPSAQNGTFRFLGEATTVSATLKSETNEEKDSVSVEAHISVEEPSSVTYYLADDPGGEVHLKGWFINEKGKKYFFDVGFVTDSVLQSRYSILVENNVAPRRAISAFEEKRLAYKKMIDRGQIEEQTIEDFLQILIRNLVDERLPRSLKEELKTHLSDIIKDPYQFWKLDLIGDALRRVKERFLGEPFVRTKEGKQFILQRLPYVSVGDLIAWLRESDLTQIREIFNPTSIQSLRVDQVISLLDTLTEIVRASHSMLSDSNQGRGDERPILSSENVRPLIRMIEGAGILDYFMNIDAVSSRYHRLTAGLEVIEEKVGQRKVTTRLETIEKLQKADSEVTYQEINDFLWNLRSEEDFKRVVTPEVMHDLYLYLLTHLQRPDASWLAFYLGRMYSIREAMGLSVELDPIEVFKNVPLRGDPITWRRTAVAFFAGYSSVGVTDTPEMISRFRYWVEAPDLDSETRRFAFAALQLNSTKLPPEFFEHYFSTKERQPFRMFYYPVNLRTVLYVRAKTTLIDQLGQRLRIERGKLNEIIWNRYFYDTVSGIAWDSRFGIHPLQVRVRDAVSLVKLSEQLSTQRLSLKQASGMIAEIANQIHQDFETDPTKKDASTPSSDRQTEKSL